MASIKMLLLTIYICIVLHIMSLDLSLLTQFWQPDWHKQIFAQSPTVLALNSTCTYQTISHCQLITFLHHHHHCHRTSCRFQPRLPTHLHQRHDLQCGGIVIAAVWGLPISTCHWMLPTHNCRHSQDHWAPHRYLAKVYIHIRPNGMLINDLW